MSFCKTKLKTRYNESSFRYTPLGKLEVIFNSYIQVSVLLGQELSCSLTEGPSSTFPHKLPSPLSQNPCKATCPNLPTIPQLKIEALVEQDVPSTLF